MIEIAITERSQLSPSSRWNVEEMYRDESSWQREFAQLSDQKSVQWLEISRFQNRLDEGAECIGALLKALFGLKQQVEKLYVYAHLRFDEDTASESAQCRLAQAQDLHHKLSQVTSWIQPQLLKLGSELFDLANAPPLNPYQIFLRQLGRLHAHTLSEEKENLLALAGKCLQAPHLAFRAFNDTDLHFERVRDSAGNEHSLTHGTYSLYMRSEDAEIRKSAYEQMHTSYLKAQHTFAQLLTGTCEAHVFEARARGYKNCQHRALYPEDIAPSIYESLIECVRARAPSLQRYFKLRAKAMNVDKLNIWDLSAPLFPKSNQIFTFDQAANLVIDASAPMGEEYVEALRAGLFSKRWVDPFETPNKRSGAYSSGCWGSAPYILLNYHGQQQDVFTLAHEAGHSMHSYLSWKAQPYHQSGYSIFVAEVASTLSEELLFRHLLDRASSPFDKAKLLYQKLEDLRATLFRQTLFAEFEWEIHRMCERGQALTAGSLRELYRSLCTHYFSPACQLSPLNEVEWARIPHFHFDFYVYQYATGVSAALTLGHQLLENDSAQERILRFLRSGGSKFPVQQLRDAGVDMTTQLPVNTALDAFDRLVDELEHLVPQFSSN